MQIRTVFKHHIVLNKQLVFDHKDIIIVMNKFMIHYADAAQSVGVGIIGYTV